MVFLCTGLDCLKGKSREDLIKFKLEKEPKDICGGIPELEQLLTEAYSYTYKERPRYYVMRELILTMRRKLNSKDDIFP